MQRPLSPFWIYRVGWTMGLSGSHRVTGMLLSLGAPLFVCWLLAIAGGAEAYAAFAVGMRHPLGMLVYAGFIFCIAYHLCNGMRHMGWDLGLGFDVATAKATGALVVVASLGLTALVLWCTFGRPA